MARFDSPMDRVPKGWEPVNTYGIYRRGNELAILGDVDDDTPHSCDAMGCGSLDHVLYRAFLPEWFLELEQEPTDEYQEPTRTTGLGAFPDTDVLMGLTIKPKERKR